MLDIPELLEEVLTRIDEPSAFLAALQVSKQWYNIGKDLIERKKEEFLRERSTVDKDGYQHVVKTLPNGTRQGEETITLKGNLVGIRPWVTNKLHGTELCYSKQAIYKEIPWRHNKRQGIQKKYLSNGQITNTYWKENNRTRRETIDHNGTIVAEDNFSSPHSFVRNKLNGNLQMIREGVYIKNHKHGIYVENGRKVLYFHGIEQIWYTEDYWEMITYIGLSLLLIYFLYKAISGRTLRPLFDWYYLIIMAIIIIVLPLTYAMWRGGQTVFG